MSDYGGGSIITSIAFTITTIYVALNQGFFLDWASNLGGKFSELATILVWFVTIVGVVEAAMLMLLICMGIVVVAIKIAGAIR